MEIKNKNIFITGGLGFIGSWICSSLIADNRILIYDNSRRNALKFSEFRRHRNLTYIKGDVLDKSFLKRSIPHKVDIIFHLAAVAGVSSYYNMPLKTMEVNLIGTYNLLEIIKKRDLKLFIDFSTSEVYGRYAKDVSEKNDTSQGEMSDMRWTYAISKLAAEKLSYCYHLEYNLPIVSIRPFNIYGPRQIGEGAIRIFISRAVENQDIVINDDGSQVRAWCYIEDFINGLLNCVKKMDVSIGNVFNLGNPSAVVSIKELAEKVIRLSGSKSRIIFRKSKMTDVECRIPDISRAKYIIGYSPKINLDEGLRRTIEWYRKNRIRCLSQ